MILFVTVLLALTLSFDCLSTGLSYGLRNITLPWYGILIICSCSGSVLALSMLLGGFLAQVIAPEIVQGLGAGVLIGLGVYILHKSVQEFVEQEHSERPLFQWSIRGLGIIVQILKEPQRADLDRSGLISSKEAVWLGLALSLDSFAAGIGLALMGYSPLWISLCTAASACLFFSVGLYLGRKIGEHSVYRKINLLPGCLLILIGLLRLIL